jgi:hypothetical protein
MRHRLLDHTSPNAYAPHQAPVAMNLPVLLANRVTQVHASFTTGFATKENTQGRHYTPKSPQSLGQALDPTHNPKSKNLATRPILLKLG